MEIVNKFAAALAGFWWALDDRERLLVLATGASVTLALLSAAGGRRERAELADAIAGRVAERLSGADAS